jgi:RND family efflux transporter MFP subunit
MTKTKKWIISIIVIVILLGSIGFWFSGKNKTIENLEKEEVKQGQVEKTVSVTGSLISEAPVVLNFENGGRIQDIKVKVGDKVAEGDLIALLDDSLLNEQVEKAKAILDKTVSQSNANNDLVREASEKVDNAEDYLEALEDYHDQLVDSAEIAYQNADDYLEDAEAYYDKVLADSGEDSGEELSAKLTLTTAQNSKKTAEEALETAKKNRDLNIISAENSLKLAEESLKTVESDYSKISLDSSVKAAENDYQIALESLKKASLKSPLNGIISKINYEAGEVIGSAGNSFGEIITDDFILEVEVPEVDISELKLNQTAEVTFDSLNYNDKFEAKIIEIEPASTRIQELIYYKVKLSLEEYDQRFKEGMSADVDILINDKKDVLMISDQFIMEENGKNFVNLLEGGKLIKKEIQVGLKGDGGYTEVISGLKNGENIYLKSEL